MMLLVVLLVVIEKILQMVLEIVKFLAFAIVGVLTGRCISLLKILMSNCCKYDCKYCINRSSNNVKRATFTPEEIAKLTIGFYKRNYIEGLFLSSAVIKSPDYTMEQLIQAISILRNDYHFNGYIHAKTIPGASQELTHQLGNLVDRMSINIELPSESSLKLLAPEKSKQTIVEPMSYIAKNLEASSQRLLPSKKNWSFTPSSTLISSKSKDRLFVPARSNNTIDGWCYS